MTVGESALRLGDDIQDGVEGVERKRRIEEELEGTCIGIRLR